MMAFLLKFALMPWSHQVCGATHLSGDLHLNLCPIHPPIQPVSFRSSIETLEFICLKAIFFRGFRSFTTRR
jgi:hypothetical protein